MSHAAARRPASRRRGSVRPAVSDRPRMAGSYVHGVVPRSTPPPGGDITTVEYGQVAALVRSATGSASGRRDLVVAHADLLDRTAVTTPVVPLRFGTVVDSPESVAHRLLAPYHDAFVAALRTLTGRAQFTVRARYDADAIVAEVITNDPAARQLHQRLRGVDPGAAHAGRVALGETVARGVRARREADAATLAGTLRPYASMTSVQVSTSVESYRIADAAFIVALDRQQEFEQALEELARQWRDRARLRLLGPMAAYHFADHLINARPEGS
jgi:hypothetical protein